MGRSAGRKEAAEGLRESFVPRPRDLLAAKRYNEVRYCACVETIMYAFCRLITTCAPLFLPFYSPRDAPVKEDKILQLEATPEMCLQCFHVLVKELTSSRNMSRSLSTSLHEHDETFARAIPATAECPLFVTWDKRKLLHGESDFRLRGCVGTLSPRPLGTSIAEYALTSALRDRRFDPIRLHEVPYLRVAVSLLVRITVSSLIGV